MTRSYPLKWPDNWPRSAKRSTSQFKTTLPKAVENVRKSLGQFGSDSGKPIDLSQVVISSNHGGGLTLGEKKIDDPGVAIYFSWDGITTCIAVDRYLKVEENLQAIHHCLEAERTKLRHGGINLVRAAFRGYAALPPPGAKTSKAWYQVLGVLQGASISDIKAAYKDAARRFHPDVGGTQEQMTEINEAYAEALKEKAAA